MPFDSAEFLGDRIASVAPRPSWHARLTKAFRRAMPMRLLRVTAEPLDTALLRVLEEARGLIEEREDWVQGRYETARGERCAVGALRLAASFLDYPAAGVVAHELLTRIAHERGFRDIETMNDHSRHEDVVAAFDVAIGDARSAFRAIDHRG